MEPWSLALVALALFPGGKHDPFEGLEHGRRTQRIEQFWLGFGRSDSRAQAVGIVVLRPPLERRVRIAGGRFVMGSTASETVSAIKLCEREPLGVRCDGPRADVGPWVRAEMHPHEVTLA